MIQTRKIGAGLLALWLSTQPALALLSSCSVSATSVNFGNYNVFNPSPTDGTGTVSVTCTVLLVGLLVSYQVSLDQGSNGSYFPRKMQKTVGSGTLDYNLYIDNARQNIWGDGTSNTSVQSVSALLQVGTYNHTFDVYGRIPAGQNVTVGTYNDVITVTIDY